jgi:hypothetical protein
MRKFVMSLVMMLFMAGLVCAVEATLVKGDADKKEVTVKEGDKETTYKYTDKLKVTLIVDKDGNTKEGKLSDFERRFKGKGKGKGKGGAKLDITVKDDTITEVKFRAGGKKKN